MNNNIIVWFYSILVVLWLSAVSYTHLVKLVACTVTMYHFISIISFEKYVFAREKLIKKKLLILFLSGLEIYLRTDVTVKLSSYRYDSEVSYNGYCYNGKLFLNSYYFLLYIYEHIIRNMLICYYQDYIYTFVWKLISFISKHRKNQNNTILVKWVTKC